MQAKNFKNWLAEAESRYLRLRPELEEPEIKKLEVEVGDIIEMGPETEFKKKKVNRISQVIKISGKYALVKDLTRGDDKLIAVPVDELHDKEELRGSRIIPGEEAQLKALGGKRLWVRLTARQYKKYASQYRAEHVPEIIPMTKDDAPSSELKKMFSPSGTEKKPEILSIFDQPNKSEPSPLKRFLAARRGIL